MKVKGEIQKVVPSLESAPGWVALSRGKQNSLVRHAERIKGFLLMEGIAALSASVELAKVEGELEGEFLTITQYIESAFPQSVRTAWRRRSDYKKLRQNWPPELIELLAAKGATLLHGSSGVAAAELITASKELQLPSSKEPKVLEGYVENDVRDFLRNKKRERRINGTSKRNEHEIAKIVFREVIRPLRSMKSNVEKRALLITVIGWVMENQALRGTFRANAIPVPDGIIAKVGRPRNNSQQFTTI